MPVEDPVSKLAKKDKQTNKQRQKIKQNQKVASQKQDCLIGDMKRLWRSLEGQEDVAGGKGEEGSSSKAGSGGKQDVCQVMGDMKLLWKSFVGPLPDGSVGQVGQ